VLRTRWRLSTGEAAGRRLAQAAALGPRRTLTGQPLEPVLPATAAAQAQGLINGEHVEVMRKAMDKVPGFVGPADRTQFEVDLVRTTTGVGPKELTDVAALTLFLLDQDGPEPDERERARTRGLCTGPQGRDGMVSVTGETSSASAPTPTTISPSSTAPPDRP
jgi:hypothetical protein